MRFCESRRNGNSQKQRKNRRCEEAEEPGPWGPTRQFMPWVSPIPRTVKTVRFLNRSGRDERKDRTGNVALQPGRRSVPANPGRLLSDMSDRLSKYRPSSRRPFFGAKDCANISRKSRLTAANTARQLYCHTAGNVDVYASIPL